MKGLFSKAVAIFLLSLAQNAASVNTRGSNMWYIMNQQQQQQQQQQDTSASIIHIHGTNYTSMSGIDTVEGADGEYVGSLDAEDWLRYDLNIPAAGTYLLEWHVSSPTGEGSFVVGNAETRSKYATVRSITADGTTARWQSIRMTVDLPSGYLPLEIRSAQGGWNLKDFVLQPYDDPTRLDNTNTVNNEFGETASSTESSSPPSLSPLIPLPLFFEIIAADDFVQMQGGELQTSSEGLDNIGWLDPSDYVIYNMALPYSGTYDLKMRISSPDGQGAFQIIHNETLELYANISNLPRTGDWQIWQTMSNPVELPGGSLPLRIVPLQPGWNLLWFSLELLQIEESSYPSQIPSRTPTSVVVVAISPAPTGTPSRAPAQQPTAMPTTPQPTLSPTPKWKQPTRAPLGTPTWSPREEDEASRFIQLDSNPDTWT